MTEQRAEIAADEASDAGVLSPVKADNDVWHDLCRCESVISIRYYYKTDPPSDGKRVDYALGWV
jgi:hypothetical protein